MSDVVIREAEIKDAGRIADLSVQLNHQMSEKEAGERISVISKDKEQKLFVAADESDNVIGFITVTAHYELLSGVQARIEGLVVGLLQRGGGVGRRLVGAAEDWARSEGSTTMKLASNSIRTEAHKFYEKIGYAKTKEQVAFKKRIVKEKYDRQKN